MLKKISEHGNCTGCSACYSACQKRAVSMISDEFGFIIPMIDESKCVKCMQCLRVCPATKEISDTGRMFSWYGWNNDDNIRKNSSSGGAFSALAQAILDKNGVIFGATFDVECKKARMVSTEGDLSRIRKSKYVDSFVEDSFIEVKKILLTGRKVLYCGTPCQIAGLKNFIGDNDDLILVDFVCHGVSSSKLFEEHIDFLSNKYRSKISNVDFRPKTMGWSDHVLKIDFENQKKYTRHSTLDTYFFGDMIANVMLKDSCYSCKYTEKHCSDITIGDFWGVVYYNQQLNDNKGISFIEANTEKGVEVVENAKKYMYLESVDKKYLDYAYFKSDPHGAKKQIQKKMEFLNLCKELGFEKAAQKTYMNKIFKRRIKVLVKNIFRKMRV